MKDSVLGPLRTIRRVVENKKDSLLNQIIKVCRDSDINATDIKRIEKAKKKTQFSNAIEEVKDILPKSLFIKNHNPLTLLHQSLSTAIHDLSDEECLEQAKNIRVILTELVKRIESVRDNSKEIEKAISTLVGKQNQPEG